ncbi:unnamed protein product [Caenorhabditis sp. 36 PRJEB53466]|nr:unnamed protein product [Caenorhabditis sp. 36 PRJEB53466]
MSSKDDSSPSGPASTVSSPSSSPSLTLSSSSSREPSPSRLLDKKPIAETSKKKVASTALPQTLSLSTLSLSTPTKGQMFGPFGSRNVAAYIKEVTPKKEIDGTSSSIGKVSTEKKKTARALFAPYKKACSRKLSNRNACDEDDFRPPSPDPSSFYLSEAFQQELCEDQMSDGAYGPHSPVFENL